MERNELKKIVYEDNNITKVVRGYILEEDEFTIKLKTSVGNNEVMVGKRALIKISNVSGDGR